MARRRQSGILFVTFEYKKSVYGLMLPFMCAVISKIHYKIMWLAKTNNATSDFNEILPQKPVA